jgi:lysine decarboxylase
MASLDAAINYMTSEEGFLSLETTYKRSIELRNKLKQLNNVRVLETDKDFIQDPTRIFVMIEGITGSTLTDILESKFRIAVESLNTTGCLFFINIGNTDKDLDRLYSAINKTTKKNITEQAIKHGAPELPKMAVRPREAFFSKSEIVSMSNAAGRVAKYPLVKCPPGVCVLIPGEVITENHLLYIPENESIDVLV